MQGILKLLPLFASLLPALALDNTSIRPRSVYQLVTDRFARSNGTTTTCDPAARQYCGGKWTDIASRLDYIKGMGFDTIWISPVVSNIGGNTGDGTSYHGYWTMDPGELNSNFGTADDLKALSTAVHNNGMAIMVDIVINHVAATSSSTFQPSSSYGPFSTSDKYHPFCWITDYTNQTNVEDCWLGDSSVALPDLDTENADVVTYWNTWVKDLVSNYTINAIRIDTVKHVRHSFWNDFTSAAGVFNQGEILLGDPEYVGNYQSNGSINPFNYPIYYPLVRAFTNSSGDLEVLVGMVSQVKGNTTDPTLLGSFLNNHDNPRFENYTADTSLIMNAHAYPLVTDGIPYVYYGSEAGFHGGNDPLNREPLWTSSYDTTSDMYLFFSALNKARSAAGNASSTFYTSQMNISTLDSSTLLISKPPLISLLTNRGSSGTNSNVTIEPLSSGWAPNTVVVDAVTCGTYTTDASGKLNVEIQGGLPRVLIENGKRGDLCAATIGSGTGTTNWASKRVMMGWTGGVGVLAVMMAGLVM